MITTNEFNVRGTSVLNEIALHGVTPSTRRQCWMFAENASRAAPSMSGKFATLRKLKIDWPGNWHNPEGTRSISHLTAHVYDVMRLVREELEGVEA